MHLGEAIGTQTQPKAPRRVPYLSLLGGGLRVRGGPLEPQSLLYWIQRSPAVVNVLTLPQKTTDFLRQVNLLHTYN